MEKIRDMKKFLTGRKAIIFTYLMLMANDVMSKTVYATGAGSADAKWNAVIGFLTPWIQRLGGAVILIGAIEFGLGFKNDDPEGKTKGLRTVIAGCIVFAVGVSSNIFLA